MARGRNQESDRQQLEAKEWRERAVKLRRQGFSIREIARRVERAPSNVHDAIEEARKAVPVEDVLALRAQQHEETLELKRKWRPLALAGDKDAAEVYLKAQTREAKLLGLDAPEKKEHTHKELPATREETLAELKKLVAEDPEFARELRAELVK